MRFVINMLTFTRIMGDSIAHPTLIVLSRSDNDFRHDATVRKSLPVEGRVPFHKKCHTHKFPAHCQYIIRIGLLALCKNFKFIASMTTRRSGVCQQQLQQRSVPLSIPFGCSQIDLIILSFCPALLPPAPPNFSSTFTAKYCVV